MPRSAARGPARRSFGRADRVATSLTPPPLSSLPQEREQLEYSSRSIVFSTEGDRLLRAWGPPERPFAVGVEPGADRWRVFGWGVGPADARAAVRALFSLDHPLEEFYRLVRKEPTLRGTERRFQGLRLPRDSGLYEALLHAIVGQQLSVSAANTIKRRIAERAEAFLEVEGSTVPRVPTPAELAGLGEPGLRSVGASGAKARALVQLALAQQGDALAEGTFRSLATDAALERLDALPGVGRWTAENALLRGLGARDLFVAGDLGLRAALDRFGVLPRSAPEEEARAWADRWYPGWGSYATLYLWRRLVTEPAPKPRADP